MATDATTTNNAVAILSRVIEPNMPKLSAEAARSILSLDFPKSDHDRMAQLAAKAQRGTLKDDERAEIEGYNEASHVLALLQARARQSLKQLGLDA